MIAPLKQRTCDYENYSCKYYPLLSRVTAVDNSDKAYARITSKLSRVKTGEL